MACHGDDVCRIVLLVVTSTFHTIPTVENQKGGNFLFSHKPFTAIRQSMPIYMYWRTMVCVNHMTNVDQANKTTM